MNAYVVTVRTLNHTVRYHALGKSSAAVADAAIDCFGVCSVTVHIHPA